MKKGSGFQVSLSSIFNRVFVIHTHEFNPMTILTFKAKSFSFLPSLNDAINVPTSSAVFGRREKEVGCITKIGLVSRHFFLLLRRLNNPARRNAFFFISPNCVKFYGIRTPPCVKFYGIRPPSPHG